MTKEEFIQQIKNIKINVPDEYFFLDYNKIVYNILDMNIRLQQQLKQRDEVIDEVIKKCELEISASSYQYDKSHKQQDLCYKVAHERILKILQKYKGDNK